MNWTAPPVQLIKRLKRRNAVANVVVLGAGLGGTLAAYELLAVQRPEDRLSIIGEGPRYHFVPSNPWVAIGWRKWVHYAKIAFEKYFLYKIRRGESEPFYERWIMETLGIHRLDHAR
jgi:hypothetical protein